MGSDRALSTAGTTHTDPPICRLRVQVWRQPLPTWTFLKSTCPAAPPLRGSPEADLGQQ